METLTLGRPYSINQFVVIPINLQHTLIYHNDEGLVAILIEHKKVLYKHEKISDVVDGGLDIHVLPELLGTHCDYTGYEGLKVNLRSVEYWVELRATEVHSDLASTKERHTEEL